MFHDRLKRYFISFSFAFLFLSVISPVFSQENTIKIGVVARRGIDQCVKEWQSLEFYLNEAVPEHDFKLIPVKFDDAVYSVERGRFDFIICNPALYVRLEALYGVSSVATQRNLNPDPYSMLAGSVIFCRGDRNDINTFKNIRGKKLAAVDSLAFTGWIIGSGELKKAGLDLGKDTESVNYAGTHDNVVAAVMNKQADVGIIGTGVFERLVDEGRINKRNFKVIGERSDLPFQCSSALYPEWCFAKLKNTSDRVAQKIAVCLLNIPADSPAVKNAGISGWSVPVNYQSVNSLLRYLSLPPYDKEGTISLSYIIRKFLWIGIIVALFISGLISVIIYILALNKKISLAVNQALRSKDYYLTLLEEFPTLVWRSDPSGKRDYFNRAWLKFTGRSLEQEIGDGWTDSLHPEDLQKYLEVYRTSFSVRKPFQIEYRLKRHDGKYRWILGHGAPLYDVERAFTGYLGSCYEITERKELNESLKANLSWLQMIIDAIPNPIFIKDQKGFYTGCNTAFLEFLGMERDEVVGHSVYEVAPPELADVYFRADMELLNRGGRQQYESKVKYGDGTLHDVVFNKAVINGADGKPNGLVGVMLDISGRKTMEEELTKTVRSTKAILEHAPFGIYLVNSKGAIDYVNASMLEINGELREHFMGVNVYDLPAYKQLGLDLKIKQVLAGDYFKIDNIDVVSANSGKKTTRNITGIPMELGAERKALIIVEDVTNRKLAEEKLREAVAAKSKFLSMVSHELRTPLTAIKEGLGIVIDGLTGELSAEQKDFLSTASRNVDRLSRLINDVLDFQKLESGKMPFSLQENDVNDAVRDAARSFETEVRGKGLILDLDLEAGLPKIQFDRDKIQQVVGNLIHNAVKFTSHGAITVSTQSSGNEVVVAVRDTGTGLNEPDIPKLFESFQQFGDEKVRKGGSGLGLAISKEIIESHHGRIWAESMPGKGSRFSFTLPKQSLEDVLAEMIARIPKENQKGQVFDLYCLKINNYEQIKMEYGESRAQALVKTIAFELNKAVGLKEFVTGRGSDEIVVFAGTSRDHLVETRKKMRFVVKESIFDFPSRIKVDFSHADVVYPDDGAHIKELLTLCVKGLIDDRSLRLEKSIMVVDDEPDMVKVLRGMLEKSGYKYIHEAYDGEEALLKLRDKQVDLVITDIQMPKMNGYELIGRLKGDIRTKDIPLVIISGYEVKVDKLREFIKKEALPLISKPFDMEQLERWLAYLL